MMAPGLPAADDRQAGNDGGGGPDDRSPRGFWKPGREGVYMPDGGGVCQTAATRVRPLQPVRDDGYRLEPRQAYAALRLGFERCRRHRRASRLDVALAGRKVRLAFLDGALEALFRACCGHLETPEDGHPPFATIDLWPAADAQPERDGHFRPMSQPGNPWGRLACDPQRRFFHDWRPHSDAALDVAARSIVGCFPDPAMLTDDERAKPLHRLVGGLLSQWGVAMVHGALVAQAGSAVLIAGAGGSGKSTTALAARKAGFDYLGDDYVGLSTDAASATGHSLFASALVGPGPLDAPGSAAIPPGLARPPAAAKTVVYVTEGLRREARLGAILLPRLGSGPDTALTPAGPPDFLLAAAPHSLLANAQDRTVALDVMTRTAGMVPVWRAVLGHDMAGVVAALATLAGRAPSWARA
jgi:hypothetical protein